MNYQVTRLNSSSYLTDEFIDFEKQTLEKIPNITYIKDLSQLSKNHQYILITNTHTQPEKIPEIILKNTALIIHPNSGHDNFEIDFLKKYNIPIILGNAIRTHAVAEYILSAILKHFCSIPNHLHWDENRIWNRKLLRDQKIAIIGEGEIGALIKNVLKPLCHELKVYDPYKNPQQNLETVVSQCNILILTASLNKKNQHLINSEKLKLIAPDALIINASRGKLIQQEDLIHFLKVNKNAFAFLDVFETEPFNPSLGMDLNNLNKTSHIAGVYKNLSHDIISFEYFVIKNFILSLGHNKLDSFLNEFKNNLINSRIHGDFII
jgi:D-3-phosphoglycerate dehydrogenase